MNKWTFKWIVSSDGLRRNFMHVSKINLVSLEKKRLFWVAYPTNEPIMYIDGNPEKDLIKRTRHKRTYFFEVKCNMIDFFWDLLRLIRMNASTPEPWIFILFQISVPTTEKKKKFGKKAVFDSSGVVQESCHKFFWCQAQWELRFINYAEKSWVQKFKRGISKRSLLSWPRQRARCLSPFIRSQISEISENCEIPVPWINPKIKYSPESKVDPFYDWNTLILRFFFA